MAKREKKQVDLMKEIKDMERKAREEALIEASKQEMSESSKEEEVLFDAWYAMRSSSIPSRHMKEILRADFAGRGLGNKETIAKYDAALGKYGVKLS